MALSNELLTFKEWYAKNPSIPYSDRVVKYNDYLKNALVDEVAVAEFVEQNEIANKYKLFLDRLVDIYTDDPEVVNLTQLDLDDPHQLALAIPVFATKIRDIALFYSKKRKDLGDLKTELSLKGTFNGLDRAVRDLFYSKYSVSDDGYNDPSVVDTKPVDCIPNKSDVVKNLEIVMVEKYNTTTQHPKPNN